MARSFAGGTDAIAYGGSGYNGHPIGCVAFWIKTTQTTTNAVPLSIWTSGTRSGIGFQINNTANKIRAVGCDATSTPTVLIGSTTSINNGAWHHVAFNYNGNNGASNQLYIDGAQEASANSSAAWDFNFGGATPFSLGLSNDPFWPSYVGELAEVAQWFDAQLTADEIAALAKGVSPLNIKLVAPGTPTGLAFYAPLIRDPSNLFNSFITGPTGTTVTNHPRAYAL